MKKGISALWATFVFAFVVILSELSVELHCYFYEVKHPDVLQAVIFIIAVLVWICMYIRSRKQ